MKPTTFASIVGLATLAFLAQGLVAMRGLGPSFDEVAHVGAAHDYIERGAYVLNRAHPPLTKQLAGLALAPLGLEAPVPEPPAAGADSAAVALHWFQEQWRVGRALLLARDDAATTVRILNRARLPLLGLALPLIVVLGLWTRAMAGAPAAVATVVLAGFAPNLLAHARLVHNDFALAVFVTLALAQTWYLRERPGLGRAAALGLALGLALASKYPAVLLGPMLVAVALTDVATTASVERRLRLLGWLRHGLVATVVAALCLAFTTARFDPSWWLDGLLAIFRDQRSGYEIYCAGRFSVDGFWYYTPVLFLTKLTVGSLGLIALGAVVSLRDEPGRPGQRRTLLVCVVTPLVVFLALAARFAFQIGFRYYLPALPLLFVVAGVSAAWLWRHGTAGRVPAALALVGHVAASLGAAPYYIGFFNNAAGGARAGYRWFDDSNVDWGQRLPALVAWHASERARDPESVIALGHFGSIDPSDWPGSGVAKASVPLEWRLLLPEFDALALSPHHLVRSRIAVAKMGVEWYPWTDPGRIHGWIAETYPTYRIESDAATGEIAFGGRAVSRDAWLADGRDRIAAVRRWLEASDEAGPVQLVMLHWQAARFFERWGGAADGERAWDQLDRVIQGLGIGARALPRELRQEMWRHYAMRGDDARATRYRG